MEYFKDFSKVFDKFSEFAAAKTSIEIEINRSSFFCAGSSVSGQICTFAGRPTDVGRTSTGRTSDVVVVVVIVVVVVVVVVIVVVVVVVVVVVIDAIAGEMKLSVPLRRRLRDFFSNTRDASQRETWLD